jgi:colanic acid biosynthesis glycosyl transferase WcaI
MDWQSCRNLSTVFSCDELSLIMRILIVSQYFWPENFKINDLSLGLKANGHDVTVLTGLPNYPHGKLYKGYSYFGKRVEKWNGIEIRRSWLLTRGNNKGPRLFLNYLSFALSASIKAFFLAGKFDLIFVWESSPVTVGIPAYFAKLKFKAPIFFWIQDLWPHSISAVGSVDNKYILNVTNWITKKIYASCDRLLIQSEAFREYLNDQGIANDKILYYPNSSEDFYLQSSGENISDKYVLPAGFNVLFAGNIGYAQDFPTVLKAVKIVKDKNPKINWIIVGEGRAKNAVHEQVDRQGLRTNVYMLGHYPSYEMPHFFSNADALLVTLKDEPIFSLTIPSKVQAYMASGKPIIGGLNGEGARIIKESGAGIVSSAESPEQLAQAILAMAAKSAAERKLMGEAGKRYFQEHFERAKLLNRLEEIFRDYFAAKKRD